MKSHCSGVIDQLTPLKGNGDAFCGTGCQSKFGTCTPIVGGSVPGLGYFSNYKTYTFESGDFPTDFHKSSDLVRDTASNANAKFDHQYVPDNVAVSGGYLVLTVPGGQTTGPIKSAEVQTVATNIQYCSVRTKAILSKEKGVVDGWYTTSHESQHQAYI